MKQYDPENPTPIFRIDLHDGDEVVGHRYAHTQRHAAHLGKIAFRLMKLKKLEDPYWTLHLYKPSYGEEISFG